MRKTRIEVQKASPQTPETASQSLIERLIEKMDEKDKNDRGLEIAM